MRGLPLFLVTLAAFATAAIAQETSVVWRTEDDLGQAAVIDTPAPKALGTPKLERLMTGTGYTVIPNFVVSHLAHKVAVKSREGCENVCDQHKTCRSFSYRAGDRRCYWTEEALKYDSQWSFFMKVAKMNDMGQMKPTGEYKRFDNIYFSEKGWRQLATGKTGCQDLCNKMDKCGSYSYREHDNKCLLSDDAVRYDTDFNYYERQNLPKPASAKKKIKVLAKEPAKKSIKDVKKVLKVSSHKAVAALKKAGKKVAAAKESETAGAAAQALMKTRMRKSIEEVHVKTARRKQTYKIETKEIQVKRVGRSTAREAKGKATFKIKNAFQEGYMKAQKQNHPAYELQVKEIRMKRREVREKAAERLKKESHHKEKISKEKAKKEKRAKEMKKKQETLERKDKARRHAKLVSTAALAKWYMTRDDKKKLNPKLTRTRIAVQAARKVREVLDKKAHIRAIHREEDQKRRAKEADMKERKEKVHHEAHVKDKREKNVKIAKKRKERSYKEIDKKERIHKREKKAKEMKKKLEIAQKNAAEIKRKHIERKSKVGQCQERRSKGQFVTYAYAREATFTDAANAQVKFGADAKYNGMLRVQNGLGNRKQRAYLKFSAKGNKIVDENVERATLLGESGTTELLQLAPDTTLGDTSQAGWGRRRRRLKLPVRWVARRRYVDRRRRWAAPVVKAARRRSVLSSRRRALVARRRRSVNLESAVMKATLKVFKFGGPASKLTVKAVSCSWKRATINWGNSGKLSLPEGLRERVLAASLTEIQETSSVSLETYDAEQEGYWARRRRAKAKLPKIRIPIRRPYVPARRRYVDRRRRFRAPKALPKKASSSPPKPTSRRRRIQGKTAGTAFAPAQNNVWVAINLSPNMVGVMRSVDKMCFEISGGGPSQPVVLGSEKSTNKPYLILNVKSKGGSRRRRCSAVVALTALTKKTGKTRV